MNTIYRISEIFGPTVQGEGPLIGKPTLFVRFGACDFHCTWCDTLYAVEPRFASTWRKMTAEEIWTALTALSSEPLLVSLSGGNPALYDLTAFLDAAPTGWTFALETQASIARDWFGRLDHLILSPKPPSAGNVTSLKAVGACLAAARQAPTYLKLVVFDEIDYLYAQRVAREFPGVPVYLQAGNHTPPLPDGTPRQAYTEPDVTGILDRLDWLAQRVCQDRWYAATVLPQLHVLLWGNRRGV